MPPTRIRRPDRTDVAARYRGLLNDLPVGVYRTTLDGRILECNRALARMLGYTAVRDLRRTLVTNLYVRPEDRIVHLDGPAEAGAPAEFELRHRDGSTIWVRDYCHVARDRRGTVRYYDGIIVDITSEREARETIKAMALHDPLTGLPNRKLLFDRLEVAIAVSRRGRTQLALMYLDLDGFKGVNDRLGHAAGDDLLVALAGRLRKALRTSDTVGRMGGDEFIVVVSEVKDAAAAAQIARKLQTQLRKPVVVEGRPVICTASLGIALYPADGETAAELLRKADAAMYRSKALGGGLSTAAGA